MASVKSLHTEGRTLQKPLVKKVTQKKAPLGGGGGPFAEQLRLCCLQSQDRLHPTDNSTVLCLSGLCPRTKVSSATQVQ